MFDKRNVRCSSSLPFEFLIFKTGALTSTINVPELSYFQIEITVCFPSNTPFSMQFKVGHRLCPWGIHYHSQYKSLLEVLTVESSVSSSPTTETMDKPSNPCPFQLLYTLTESYYKMLVLPPPPDETRWENGRVNRVGTELETNSSEL